MRVRLNLATKALETHRKFLLGASVLGVVAAIVFLGLGWHVYVARKAAADMRAESERIRRELTGLEQRRTDLERFFGLPENAKLHERAAYINTLIDARSFNWTRMFMDLGRILPPGVHVMSIEPKQEKGRVEIKFTVGATSDETKLKFLRALENSKTFTHIELLREHAPTQATTGDQTVVELTAEYSRT